MENELLFTLESLGWFCDNFYPVADTEGREGIRYEISKSISSDVTNSLDLEGLKSVIKDLYGDRAIFSQGYYRYAPEIKQMSIVILNEPKDGSSID